MQVKPVQLLLPWTIQKPDSIIDENKGRSVAKRLGLKVTGTIGVIIKAKEQGLIHSGKDLLNRLDQHGFWLSEKLKRQIMERMKE